MGGRGSGSSKGSFLAQYERKGKLFSNVKDLNPSAVEDTLKGINDTLKEFGVPTDRVSSVEAVIGKGEFASVNGAFQLMLDTDTYSKSAVSSSNGFNVDDSFRGHGTHEAGHLVSMHAFKNMLKAEGKFNEKGLHAKWDEGIIKEASKNLGIKLSAISGYGSKRTGNAAREFVAESVSAYMKYGSQASDSAKAVVNVLKNRVKKYG